MTERIINSYLFACPVSKQHSLTHGYLTNTGRFPNKVCVEVLGHVGWENKILRTDGPSVQRVIIQVGGKRERLSQIISTQ